MTRTAASTADGLANLTGRNQLVLEGLVVAVLTNGALQVDVGRGALTCGAIIDRVFRAGERVRLMATDQGAYLCIGLATQGGGIRTTAWPIAPWPSSGLASEGLGQALMRVVARQNQVLRRGQITAVLADGALEIAIRSGPVLARAATNEVFRAGQVVYAIREDAGGWRVMGSHGG